MSNDHDRAQVLRAVRRRDTADGGSRPWEIANRTGLSIDRAADACRDLLAMGQIETKHSRGGVLYAPRSNQEVIDQWNEDRSAVEGDG